MQDINKILIIEVAGIGDVVMSVPSLRALRKKYPGAYIAVLVSSRAFPLLERCPYVNEIFTFDIENFNISKRALNLPKTLRSLKAILKLRFKKIDVAINLYQILSFRGSARMRLLFRAISPRLSVGRNEEGEGKFFDLKFEGNSSSQHEVETKLKVVGLLEAATQDKKLELWPSNEDETYALAFLNQLKIRESNFLIGINPNTIRRTNLWPEERFAEVADVLIERYNAKVIFFGSSADRKRVNKIISHMRNKPINLTGKLTLNRYVSLIKRIKLFITSVSGPMHIASVFKVPTLALFGAEQPLRFGPYLNEKATILQKNVGCNPCKMWWKCKTVRCMEAITVNDVLSSFEELMKKCNLKA